MFHVKHHIKDIAFDWHSSDIDQKIEESLSSFAEYADRLLWWNKKVNLISRNVSRETLMEHMRHSLTLSTVPEVIGADLLVDAGCGGGLPGIPLAINMPDTQLLLNDIVSKKIIAVKQMVRTLGLQNVECVSGNVSGLDTPEHLLISKHAFKVNELYNLCAEQSWSSMIMLKGKDEVEEELDGIGESLDITIYDLFAMQSKEFYNGKAIAVIKRSE